VTRILTADDRLSTFDLQPALWEGKVSDSQTDFTRLAELTAGLGPHQHLCLIYDTRQEQFAAALPFLKAGLERGEKCLYFADENTAAAALDALGKGGTDVDRYLRSGALTINHKRETDLQQGRFDPDWWVGFLNQATAEAVAANSSGLRILGDMDWALRGTDRTGKLIEFESRINQFLRDHDARVICQYNRNCNTPELILGIIRTHPVVVYGGLVCKNPYYVPPEEFLKPNQAAQEAERLLNNILAWERAQQALRQSEDRLRLVIDTVPALIHTGLPDGSLDFFNQRWLNYVGVSLEDLLGWKWTALIHPEDVGAMVEKWRAALAAGEPLVDEARVRRADGEYRWMVHHDVPWRDERGNIVKWYASSIDIEDRKRAEVGLREAANERSRMSAVRAEIAMALARKGSLKETLRACAEAMVHHLDAAFARIWTLNSDSRELELQASAGMYTRVDGRYSRVPVGEIKIGLIAQERKAHLTNDVQNDPRIDDKDWAKAEKITSFAGYPLVVEDRVVGVMGTFFQKPITESTLGTLSFLGDGIAQGIERKRAEEELRRSEDHLRLIIDTIPIMAWSVRPDGTVDFLNQRWLDYSGLSLEQYVQEPTGPIHPDDIPRVMEKWRAGMAAGEPYEQEMRLRRADGEYRWFLVRTAPLRDQQGTIVKWYGVSIDIEDRKRADEELRQAEDRIRAILEFSPNWIFLKDTEGRYLLVNKEVERVFRISQEQIKGKTDSEIFPPEHAAEYRANDLKVLRAGLTMEFEEVADLEDGPHTSIVHKFPLFDTHGNIYATGGVAIDITERKRAEEALRKSEARWRSVFENSAIGVALTDLHGRFLATNPVYQKMVGYNEENLRELTFLDITHQDYRGANWALVGELLDGKREQFQIEKQYRRKDGSLIWVRNTVSLVAGTEAVPRFIMALSEDITERKKAEEALRRSEAYLAAGQRLSHTGSWALNLASGELYWSQETYRIFGFDPAKTRASVSETFLPRVHPEDRPKIKGGLKRAADQKGSYAVDYRIVLPDGSVKHIHDVVYPVTSETGDVMERYGVVMDVTERRRAEEARQKSHDQLRALAARLQSVREEERTRVAREIHDELGQALTAIKIDLSSLSHELAADKKHEYESILKLVDETIESVRRISTELRPAILDAMGLVAAVEWAAGEFEARTGTKCRLDLPQEDIAIDPQRATALFRIFQETLTNVARHANATEVSVRLAKENGNLSLRVRDNGKGISEEQLSAGSSLGILGMRERALLLGGKLAISGAAGEGTIVRVRIPETYPPSRSGN
jgi:PAS domain S-box-containing protein